MGYYDRLREQQNQHYASCYPNQGKQHKRPDCNTIPSGFRAISIADQAVAANTPVKVVFQFEEFDLAGEYNPATSTFVPKADGVYNVLASISFNPIDAAVDYRARVDIRVNGTPAAAIDNDFFGGGLFFQNVVSAAAILQLRAGDRVEVFAQSSTAGFITAANGDGVATHFEAARFPSPSKAH